jgi:signal transduction histidine kinase
LIEVQVIYEATPVLIFVFLFLVLTIYFISRNIDE